MLRIVSTASEKAGNQIELRLVGQVSGKWVAELDRLTGEALAAGRRLEIDMAEVTFVDRGGLQLFKRLLESRVPLINCALFVAEQLKTLEQDV
jgi:ABC-type transporter Mla MlaB component